MIDHEHVMRRMLGREPTVGEFDEFNRILSAFPPDIRNSDAAMLFVIVLSSQVRAFKDVVQNASFEAQQRIHKDLPGRIDEVALNAVRRIRDTLPVDSSERFRRLLRNATIATAIVLFLGAAVGFILGERAARHVTGPMQAVTEVTFDQCLDAAFGAAASGDGRRGRSHDVDTVTYRQKAVLCAAQYADRRATM